MLRQLFMAVLPLCRAGIVSGFTLAPVHHHAVRSPRRRPAAGPRSSIWGRAPSVALKASIWDDLTTQDGVPRDAQVIDVYDLLLCRSICTQLHIWKTMRNELSADWLRGFLNHDHLTPEWSAVVGTRYPLPIYLRALFTEEPVTVEVRCRVGGPNDQPSGDPANEAEAALAEEQMGRVPEELRKWQTAAASRRNNPYLNREPKFVTYDETIEPKLIATTLMAIASTLAIEFREDLDLLYQSDDPAAIEASKQLEKDIRIAQKAGEEGNTRPPPLFESAERSRTADGTPLRKKNYDLLVSTSTILAILSVQTELAAAAPRSNRARKELEWLDDFTKSWWPRLAGIVTDKRDVAGPAAAPPPVTAAGPAAPTAPTAPVASTKPASTSGYSSGYYTGPPAASAAEPVGTQPVANVPALVASDYLAKISNASSPHNVSGFYTGPEKGTNAPPVAVAPMAAVAAAPTDRAREGDAIRADAHEEKLTMEAKKEEELAMKETAAKKEKQEKQAAAGASTTAELFFDELTRRPPSLKGNVLIDPPSLGDKIRSHRRKVCEHMISRLKSETVDSMLSAVEREAVDRSMLENQYSIEAIDRSMLENQLGRNRTAEVL